MTQNRRQFIRVPIKSRILYADEGHVFKSSLLNISIGGVFIENLPHIPSVGIVPILFELPQIPDFQTLSEKELKRFDRESIENSVLRMRVKTIRKEDVESTIDAVFDYGIGAEFIGDCLKQKDLINSYVETMVGNIGFLIRLFQERKKSDHEIVLKICESMGYSIDLKYSQLHQKVLKDYQGMNW
ncbi:MAG: PilZ domain-containing protein [Bacteriovoracaceae bacterium]|jgi:hypothetical protein|nr:PilZ domain-containing protein [Bacteriovoracaceae bacterium]